MDYNTSHYSPRMYIVIMGALIETAEEFDL